MRVAERSSSPGTDSGDVRLTPKLTRAPQGSSGARAQGCVGLSDMLGGMT